VYNADRSQREDRFQHLALLLFAAQSGLNVPFQRPCSVAKRTFIINIKNVACKYSRTQQRQGAMCYIFWSSDQISPGSMAWVWARSLSVGTIVVLMGKEGMNITSELQSCTPDYCTLYPGLYISICYMQLLPSQLHVFGLTGTSLIYAEFVE